MKRHSRFAIWVTVSITILVQALGFLLYSPEKAFASTRSSYIIFYIPFDNVAYLKVEGNNQNDNWTTWSKTFSPPTMLVYTQNGTTKWWWNGTITLTFKGQTLGERRCVIDNLNTAGSGGTVVSYTPGMGCSGDTGNARSIRRTVEEMSNYMSSDEAYQIVEATDFATNALECLEGIAAGLASRVPVMTVIACAGAALYPINQILHRYGTHLNAANSDSSAGSSGRWAVRIFNMDDWGKLYLNEDWDNPVAAAEYGEDTGWVDITSRMTAGDNLLIFGNWNISGGYTWGFQVSYNDSIVWSSQEGQQGVYGANNDDTSRSYQYTHAEWLMLRADGTVTQR